MATVRQDEESLSDYMDDPEWWEHGRQKLEHFFAGSGKTISHSSSAYGKPDEAPPGIHTCSSATLSQHVNERKLEDQNKHSSPQSAQLKSCVLTSNNMAEPSLSLEESTRIYTTRSPVQEADMGLSCSSPSFSHSLAISAPAPSPQTGDDKDDKNDKNNDKDDKDNDKENNTKNKKTNPSPSITITLPHNSSTSSTIKTAATSISTPSSGITASCAPRRSSRLSTAAVSIGRGNGGDKQGEQKRRGHGDWGTGRAAVAPVPMSKGCR